MSGTHGDNMDILRKVVLILISIFVVGCSTTGGTIGGLFPAPKLLDGKIEKDIYFSKDNEFKIAIPHKEGTYEFTYLQIKEQYSNLGAYISFGPAAIDPSIYRLEIGRKLSPESHEIEFESAANAVIANYSEQLRRAYKSEPKLIKKDKAMINGNQSYVIKLTQDVQNNKVEHEVIVINYPNMAAIFWVQKYLGRADKAHINALEFAQSFTVL